MRRIAYRLALMVALTLTGCAHLQTLNLNLTVNPTIHTEMPR